MHFLLQRAIARALTQLFIRSTDLEGVRKGQKKGMRKKRIEYC